MQNINSDLIRGNIDTIILKTMQSGDMYGLDIIREVESKSNGTYELKQPTLYSCLKRLENQELISSYWVDSEIGGKRHYYKLTEKGQEIVRSKQDEWEKSKLLIDNLLGNFNFDEFMLVKKEDYDTIIAGKENISNKKLNNQIDNNAFEEKIITKNGIEFYQQTMLDNSKTINIKNSQNDNKTTAQDDEVLNEDDASAEDENFTEDTIEEEIDDIEIDSNVKETSIEDLEKEIEKKLSEQKSENYLDNELICFKNTTPKNHIQNNFFDSLLSNSTENQKSYSETINYTPAPKNIIQENLFDEKLFEPKKDVGDTINEFSKNISKLYNFNYAGDGRDDEEDKENNGEENNNDNSNKNETIIDDSTAENVKTDNIPSNCFVCNNNILGELDELAYQEIDNNIDFNNTSIDINNNFNDNYQKNNQESFQNYSTEAPNYDTQNNTAESAYQTNFQQNNNNYNYYQPNINSNEQTFSNNSQNYDFSYNGEKSIFSDAIWGKNTFDTNSKFESENMLNTTTLDDIINHNVSKYTYDNTVKNSSFSKYDQFDKSYKEKIKNLSKYSKTTTEKTSTLDGAKDIPTLKDEFSKNGIEVKQYSKNDTNENKKNYVLINKLNFLKSIILLLFYAFLMSAIYVVVNYTKAKEKIPNFTIEYFFVAISPFIINMIFYLAMYIAKPYRKIILKKISRSSIFSALLFTVILISLTYCLNIQMGFTNFNQLNYNHLFWLIPTPLCISPIISVLIHIALFHSKNFESE